MRIVSLLPSATEIVCALGLEHQLVAVSHGCDYPASVQSLPSATSTIVPYDATSDVIDSVVREHLTSHAALYELDMAVLEAVAPDIIVSQALCDVCAVSTGDVIGALESLPSKPVLIDLEPNTFNEVLEDCLRVGEALGQTETAAKVVDGLQGRFDAVTERTATIAAHQCVDVAFLEWLLPPFNGGHWNPEIVNAAGGKDLLGAPGKPSSTLTWNRIAEAKPELVFVACCGFTIDRAMQDLRQLSNSKAWNRLPAVKNRRVIVADGNAYFSRPGPRLLDGLEMMAHAFHPDVHPASARGKCRQY